MVDRPQKNSARDPAERDEATDQPSMLLGDIVRCDQATGTRKIKGLDK